MVFGNSVVAMREEYSTGVALLQGGTFCFTWRKIMRNYELANDEVILYHGPVTVLPDGKPEGKKFFKREECELLLTNHSVVFLTNVKQFLKRDFVQKEIFGIDMIKYYNEAPYVVREKDMVEIYFLGAEKFVVFADKKEAKEFTNKILKAASGYSKLVRIVKNIQREIRETDKALDIDTVGIAKMILGIATTAAIDLSALPVDVSKKRGLPPIKVFGAIAKAIKKNNTPKLSAATLSEEKIKELMQLKSLLDDKLITQEEFDQRKEECLYRAE